MSQVDLFGNGVENLSSPYCPVDSPASRSVVPGSEKARAMTVSSGRKCSALLRSCGPLGCLERMLLESSEWHSTIALLTWRISGTPAGRSIFQLVPSVPSIGERGSSLLLTPSATQIDPTEERFQKRTDYRKSIGRKWVADRLSEQLAMLPTPTTPRPHDTEKTAGVYTKSQNQKDLTYAITTIPTITCNTGKNTSPGINFDMREKKAHLDGVFMNQVGKKNGLQLQPAFAEWMMGFPTGYTDLPASEMPLSRNKSIRSSKQSQTSKGGTK